MTFASTKPEGSLRISGGRSPFVQRENCKQLVQQSTSFVSPKLPLKIRTKLIGWGNGFWNLEKVRRTLATRGSRRIWSGGRLLGTGYDEGPDHEVFMILKDILTRDIYPLEGKKKGGGGGRLKEKRDLGTLIPKFCQPNVKQQFLGKSNIDTHCKNIKCASYVLYHPL